MIWKTILLTFLAVGVLTEYQVMDKRREALKNIVKDMCKKNGAEDQADAVETAVLNNLVECKDVFSTVTIGKEIEEPKGNFTFNEVIKMYCAKIPKIKTCLHNFLNDLSPCLDATIRETSNNQTDELLDFLCHKDGERIALFIADGGVECIQEKAIEISQCRDRAIDGITSVYDMFVYQTCSRSDEMYACILKALKGCNTPTPGNIFESLIRLLRKSCKVARVIVQLSVE